jgi:hypothetical protein
MANYDLKAQLIGFDGNPIPKEYKPITQEEMVAGKKAEVKSYWTLEDSLITALNVSDEKAGGDDLLKRYKYLMDLRSSQGTIELESEDITYLKSVTKKVLINVILLGETHRLLESPIAE